MRNWISVVTFLMAALSVFAQNVDNPDITEAELKDHVYYLASDTLKGRKPGTEGGRLAAEYIRDAIQKNGLELLGQNGFQYFEVTTGVEAGEDNALSFAGYNAKLEEEFSPLSFSENGAVKSTVVFAGYGFDFDTDSVSWHDYENIDVEGKIVLMLLGDPEIDKHESLFIPYSGMRKKVLVAKDHGAAAVVFVAGETFEKEDKLIGVNVDKSRTSAGIPVIQIKRSLADRLLKNQSVTITELESQLNKTWKPNSFKLPVAMYLKSRIIKYKDRTQNVVGLLEGNDPDLKDEYIVLGAHYDHLGMGGPGSGSRRPDTVAVHNGADDNASGVAATLEIIEKLSDQRQHLKRSVLFIAFGAEEMGLLGSEYFTSNPLVNLNKINFMFNLDMVGRMNPDEPALTVGGAGTAKGFEQMLNEMDSLRSFTVNQSSDGYGPSDHAAFYMENIPVAFIFTEVHDDYHTPADDADRLNYAGEKLVTEFTFDLLLRLANLPEALAYQEAGPKQREQRRTRLKATLGIMPDYAGKVEKGLGVDAVMNGRPADRAGMKKGDVIVAINGKSVGDIYEYMARLSEYKPGDRISVKVIRDGMERVLIVEL